MNKLELLQEELRNYGKVAIAYSGGVDSNFLFHVALETLGKENVLPVLCRGAMMSKEDIEGALEQLKDSNHVVLSVNPLDVEAFHFNHKDRCYHCKRSIMSKVIAVAKEHDFAYVLDGKNKDDEKVYRPGLKACEELGIISPLANNNLTKQQLFNQRAFAIMQPVMYMVMHMVTLGIYFVGAYLINEAAMADKIVLFGDMVVFSSYALQVIMSFLMLAMIFMMLPRAQVSANRINEVLETQSSIKDGNITKNSKDEKGTVEFKIRV